MEIKKVAVKGVPMLSFERMKKTGDADSEELSRGLVPYENKKDLLTALESSRIKIAKGGTKDETLDEVYKTETFSAFQSISAKAVLRISIGSESSACAFELNHTHVAQLIAAIKAQ